MKVKKGMVFGVFDGLHEGHKYFLKKAEEMCEQLVVVIARDEVAFALKGYAPKQSEEERVRTLKSLHPTFKVVLGDARSRKWTVLKTHTPDKIFLGYDQKEIGNELEKLGVSFEYIKAHEPERFKSTFFNGKEKE